MITQIALFIIVASISFYIYFIKPLNYWKNKGLIQGNRWKLLKDIWIQILKLKPASEIWQNIYNEHPDARYYGIYISGMPSIFVKDPDLIKQIMVKDFDNFLDHSPIVPEADKDPLWQPNLFAETGQKWRDSRPVISPSFTSSKMKIMYHLMYDCAEIITDFFHKKNESVIIVNFQDLARRYANDIIATTTFGVKVDSVRNPNNEFYTRGTDMVDYFALRRSWKFFITSLVPSLAKIIPFRVYEGENRTYFKDMIENTLKQREEKGIVRPDMLQLLIETRRGLQNDQNGFSGKGPKTISNEDIVAHSFIFFFAGLDSVSSFLIFMAYELAINPDVQLKLREEIREAFSENSGKMAYERMAKMNYLDMVISETLRKWPNFVFTDRVCTKQFVIEPKLPCEKQFVIEEGMNIKIPIMPIQYDPKYWSDPQRFDPERFSEENKGNFNPYTYIPFGIGPRNCIALRFAVLEAKVLFTNLLQHWEIVPVADTPIPVKISRKNFNLNPEGGLALGLKKLVE